MFNKKYKSGLIPNPFDPRDVFEDELFAAGEDKLPIEYRIDDLMFEPQGATPYCVSFATTKMAEYQLRTQQSIVQPMSMVHLFMQAGGSLKGSYFRSNMEIASRRGLLSYKKLELEDNIWNWDYDKWKRQHDRALAIPFDGAHKTSGYVRISPEREKLKRAIMQYGPLMVGVYAGGGYWRNKTERMGRTDNHAVILVGWNMDDSWIVFDSLQPKAGFFGYHNLSPDYNFYSAYALTVLPDDWKDQRDEARKSPENNENRYGKPRNYEAEVRFAKEMLDEFGKFKNQSVLEAAGKFWEMYIRAGVYGGYNLSYKKWGRWQSGDILNDCYHWRRTGQHAFDFNKLRSEQ